MDLNYGSDVGKSNRVKLSVLYCSVWSRGGLLFFLYDLLPTSTPMTTVVTRGRTINQSRLGRVQNEATFDIADRLRSDPSDDTSMTMHKAIGQFRAMTFARLLLISSDSPSWKSGTKIRNVPFHDHHPEFYKDHSYFLSSVRTGQA